LDPDFLDELRIVNADGTKIETHYTAPIIDPKTGRAVNDSKITAPEAGYVPTSASPDKSGHGWNLVSITTSSGLPLAHAVVPLNAPERETLLGVIRGPFAERIAPRIGVHLGDTEVGVAHYGRWILECRGAPGVPLGELSREHPPRQPRRSPGELGQRRHERCEAHPDRWLQGLVHQRPPRAVLRLRRQQHL
jgi:hypothetical protein